MTEMQTKVLVGAADLLEEKGWVQGVETDPEGRRCALGAIMASARDVAMDTGMTAARLCDDSADLLRFHIRERSIMLWNDDPARTKGEVVAALRKAAQS